LAFGLLSGIASAAGVLVGQRLGRDDLGDAERRGQQLIRGGVVVALANMILAGAVLNAGGDSRFVLVMESLATWVVGVPTAFVAAFVFGLPVWAVYLLLSLKEVVRVLAGWRRLRSRRWLRNLTANGSSHPPTISATTPSR
jgi:Na+-driven multidrug efflux pump